MRVFEYIAITQEQLGFDQDSPPWCDPFYPPGHHIITELVSIMRHGPALWPDDHNLCINRVQFISLHIILGALLSSYQAIKPPHPTDT